MDNQEFKTIQSVYNQFNLYYGHIAEKVPGDIKTKITKKFKVKGSNFDQEILVENLKKLGDLINPSDKEFEDLIVGQKIIKKSESHVSKLMYTLSHPGSKLSLCENTIAITSDCLVELYTLKGVLDLSFKY